jgi:cysteine desulfurase
MIYLDANATEPLRPEARMAALAAMEACGNPASIHQAGRAARRILEDARELIANLMAAQPQDIIFCSGATEANTLAVRALGAGRPILAGATEHDAIRAAAPHAITIPVLPTGQVDPDMVKALLTVHPGALVCLMAANNETGVLHDIATLAKICAEAGALLHVDAVQAASRCREDWLGMGASSIAISGHKAGGPMGAGALILSPGRIITADISGGGQEQGRRGGTQALPAIAGMAAALNCTYDTTRIAALRDQLEQDAIALTGATIHGAGAPRLPNTTCLGLENIRADTQLIGLDLAGFAVSAGSACSSGRVSASHVLTAMGASSLAGSSIRVSLPWNVTAEDITAFSAAYTQMAERASASARLRLPTAPI